MAVICCDGSLWQQMAVDGSREQLRMNLDEPVGGPHGLLVLVEVTWLSLRLLHDQVK